LFAKRQAVSVSQREAAAQSARQLLVDHPFFLNSQNIACYFAQDNEFDCGPIMQAVWAAKKTCFLPVLSDGSLIFAFYQPNNSLCLNRYKILEPENKVILPPEKLDLVLMPVVGFDLQGSRLGMGGGYYDKTFSFLHEKKQGMPRLMGLAYECQYTEEIPEEPFDIPMDAVLTESRIYTFPK
jgi:5-formyltetrahydrofolate cyclo-ligase